MPKGFKNIDDQLSILKGRGLGFDDEEIAKNFLLKNNYYRISGYSLTLRNHDTFYPDSKFQNIIDIYEFDRELRNILLWAIEIIEVNFKSIYAYLFSKHYGPLGYLDSKNFSDQDEYDRIMAKAEYQKSKNLEYEAYLKHFVYDLKEEIPFWAFVDLLTISDISFLYTMSDPHLRKEIASEYGLNFRTGSDVMQKYMHGMTIVRNLCAHDSRLFNRLFITKPSLNPEEKRLLRVKSGQPDNSLLFGYIINIRRLIPVQTFSEFKSRLISTSDKYPFVDMRYYGFRSDWKMIL